MNKRLIVFLICVALSAALVTWLTRLDKDESGQNPVSETPAAEASPAAASPEASPETTAIPLEAVSDAKLKEYKANAQAAMDSIKDVYLAADKGSSSNVVLSSESVSQIVSALGANGYTAVDYFGNLNVQNAQPLIDFGNAVNAGVEGEACYYVVHTDGTLHANNL